MARPRYFKDCIIECESRSVCAVCGRTKKPWGRDSRDNGLCDTDCEGYAQDPRPGHLWPGELAEMDKEDSDA